MPEITPPNIKITKDKDCEYCGRVVPKIVPAVNGHLIMGVCEECVKRIRRKNELTK